jgi:hypothetical protein
VAELREFDEILSACLEALDRGEGLEDVLARYPQASAELKPLLEAAVWFEVQKAAVEPRPGFVGASRLRLVERIVVEPALTGNWLERAWAQLITGLGGRWRVALQVALVVVILAFLVVGGSGVALASQEALPGDALYSIKIGLEQAELILTPDTAAKIQLHNQFAQARLLEIEELVMEGRYSFIRETVSNFEKHVNRASQLLSDLAQREPQKAEKLAISLKETLAGQRDFLSFLMAAVPRELAPEILRAMGISASGEVAIQAALDQASNSLLLTTTPTPTLGIDTASASTSEPDQRSLPSPTPTLVPSSTSQATATATATRPALTVTPTRTLIPTRTMPPTYTPTAKAVQDRPTPTYTPRPPRPTNTPEPPPPEKTKKPPPNPTRRPPKDGK